MTTANEMCEHGRQKRKCPHCEGEQLWAENSELLKETALFRAMIEELLASAHPNAKEHPTMHAAWEKARKLLAEDDARIHAVLGGDA